MIKYYIKVKDVHVWSFISSVQISKGDFVKCTDDTNTEHNYIVEQKHIHVTHHGTEVILNCK